MINKGRVQGEYEVALTYTGLTMDELSLILKTYDRGCLYSDLGHDYSPRDLQIGKVCEQYDDSCGEPIGTYNITLIIGQDGCIDKDSWLKQTENDIMEAFNNAEKIRQLIKDKTGIE